MRASNSPAGVPRVAAALLATLPVWFAAPASAQRVVSHDTLSGDSPVAITCGFCAGERLGVVFRELAAPARGIDPADFPLVLSELRVALASARVTGTAGAYTCGGSTTGGSAAVDVEVWAGTTVPTGSIRAMPAADPWPGETLAWSGTADLGLSVAEAEGSMRYEVDFNRLLVEDESSMPVRVAGPAAYLRVVLTLPAGADTSASCADLSLDPPGAFPVRDDDGRIAPERSFIYAGGIGWLWNEEVPGMPIGGDWAIRVEIAPEGSPRPDAGPIERDAGSPDPDAGGAPDAGAAAPDAGAPSVGGGGCGCATSRPGTIPWATLPIALAWALRLRRRARR